MSTPHPVDLPQILEAIKDINSRLDNMAIAMVEMKEQIERKDDRHVRVMKELAALHNELALMHNEGVTDEHNKNADRNKLRALRQVDTNEDITGFPATFFDMQQLSEPEAARIVAALGGTPSGDKNNKIAHLAQLAGVHQ